MEERRYEIRQYGEEEWTNRIITESELKRRLLEFRYLLIKEPHEIDWPTVLSILLHGEKEQEITGTTAYGVARTDAWDEWVDKMPIDDMPMSWIQAERAWLRACPCRR